MAINNVINITELTRTTEEPTVFANQHSIIKFPNASFTATCSSVNTDFIHELYNSAFENSVAEVVIGKQQKRKHKKRRINKKWAKRYGYYDIVLTGNLRCSEVGMFDRDMLQHSFELENPKIFRRESEC